MEVLVNITLTCTTLLKAITIRAESFVWECGSWLGCFSRSNLAMSTEGCPANVGTGASIEARATLRRRLHGWISGPQIQLFCAVNGALCASCSQVYILSETRELRKR